MTRTALNALVSELEDVFARDPKGAAVPALLEAYARENACWRSYALFKDDCYARNLVARSGAFELLVICWKAGQVSPIHDHQGQRCWMTVLDGSMRERHFRQASPAGSGLVPGLERVFEVGSVAYISDEIALHDIGPAGGEDGVTLHLYARPIGECNIFDFESGEVTLRGLVYHSVDGVPQGPA